MSLATVITQIGGFIFVSCHVFWFFIGKLCILLPGTSIPLCCIFCNQYVHIIFEWLAILHQNPWFLCDHMISFSFYICFGSIRQEKKDPKMFGKIILIPMGEITPSRAFYFTPRSGWSKLVYRPKRSFRWSLLNDRQLTVVNDDHCVKIVTELILYSNQSSWRSGFRSWYGSPSYRSPFRSSNGSFQKSNPLLERTASERTLNRPVSANIVISEHRTLSATPSLGSPYLQTPTRKP